MMQGPRWVTTMCRVLAMWIEHRFYRITSGRLEERRDAVRKRFGRDGPEHLGGIRGKIPHVSLGGRGNDRLQEGRHVLVVEEPANVLPEDDEVASALARPPSHQMFSPKSLF